MNYLKQRKDCKFYKVKTILKHVSKAVFCTVYGACEFECLKRFKFDKNVCILDFPKPFSSLFQLNNSVRNCC